LLAHLLAALHNAKVFAALNLPDTSISL